MVSRFCRFAAIGAACRAMLARLFSHGQRQLSRDRPGGAGSILWGECNRFVGSPVGACGGAGSILWGERNAEV